jgi:hypothetical protein
MDTTANTTTKESQKSKRKMQNRFFRFLLSALFLLSGCAKREAWEVSTIRTGDEHHSSKLSCASRDPVNGIDLDFLMVAGELSVYLTVHSRPVPSYPLDEKTALVKLVSEDRKKIFLAIRREGGQRLLLPESIHAFILDSLKQGKPLLVQVCGYQAKIEPNNFNKQYHEFLEPSSLKPSIRLPI